MDRRSFLTAAAALPWAATARGNGASVRLRELYQRGGGFSEFTHSNTGQRVTVKGFMAPPLKAETRFFVLTKLPMSVCPFCSDAAAWPNDILAVYTKRTVEVIPFNQGIDVTGVLETGEYLDPDTGFVSLLRLTDAVYG